jgi:DNA repair protein RadD
MKDKLYYYQRLAVKSVFDYYLGGDKGNPLVVIPTGGGKTHVLAALCEGLIERWPEANILILSHVKEILVQNYSKLIKHVDPSLIGLYSSGLGSREVNKVTVAGIQSIYKQGRLFRGKKMIVIVDEAHLIPATGEGRYLTLFKSLPNTPIIGLTATPYRLGFGLLTGEGHLFDKITYEANIKDLIDQGYLCKLTSKAAKEQMDLTGVKVVAGEYSAKSLSEKLDRFDLTSTICNELIKYKTERKHWLVFAIDIKHAEHISTILDDLGVTAAYVHSKMRNAERDVVIRLFKAGKIQALINVEALTTGFDYPEIDLVALLRPTKSPVLHVQMIGRGLRKHESKKDSLILDFAGNLKRIGPIDKITIDDMPIGKGRKGQAPTKVCPECDEVLLLSAKECEVCGHKFETQSKLTTSASDAALFSSDVVKKVKDYEVRAVYYHKHTKVGSPASLKVSYVCNNAQVFQEWVLLEQDKYFREKASAWWKFRTGMTAPLTVDEALLLQDKIHQPLTITVDESGKYPRIINYKFKFEEELSNVRQSLKGPA